MKVTRSYWLGLGSGLILSAMLTLIISPQQHQAVLPKETASDPVVKQQVTTQPLAGVAKPTDPALTAQPSVPTQSPVSTQLSQGQPPSTQSSSKSEQNFIIPKGASSEQIANLLAAQGFIKDKASFLVSAHQMGVESQFRAGTFTLALGLIPEEVIRRLLKEGR